MKKLINYRIVHCKKYNEKRLITKVWWEVECLKRTWWIFGKRWFTEKKTDSYIFVNFNIEFESEDDAYEYIKRTYENIPKNTIIKNPTTHFI